jgi:copper chaperone CopZ
MSETITGCADAHVVRVDDNTATFLLRDLDQTISHPITLLPQKQSFSVIGLTCNNCVAHVKEALEKDSSLKNIVVSLEDKSLTFDAVQTLLLSELNALLSGTKYSVVQVHIQKKIFLEKVQTFIPLITMFTFVLLFTFFHQYLYGFHIHAFMQYFMAGYFLLFGGLKVLNWKKFVESYRAYDALAGKSMVYALAYPAIEFGLGILYYFSIALLYVNLFVVVLMLQKAYSVYIKLKSGHVVQCACLGGFFKIPITRVTLAEDALMALMAVWMLV